ncbi:MAG: hypothetical protein A2Y33_09545 [Spirochaetes bacterium GWF1_51_8]|nr:MAG: hypothetical protein A2Y33_09545 [Spirochaetes bacterium GWF1_51_8]
MQSVFLKTGESIVTAEEIKVITILGSCVSVVIFDPILKMGAISHALLPDSSFSARTETKPNPMQYVEEGFYALLDYFYKKGIKKWRLEVKIFGGAKVNYCDQNTDYCTNIGEQNYLKALEVAEREGLKVLAKDIGGDRGRKLVFYTAQGVVYRKIVSDKSKELKQQAEVLANVEDPCVSCRRFRKHPSNA